MSGAAASSHVDGRGWIDYWCNAFTPDRLARWDAGGRERHEPAAAHSGRRAAPRVVDAVRRPLGVQDVRRPRRAAPRGRQHEPLIEPDAIDLAARLLPRLVYAGDSFDAPIAARELPVYAPAAGPYTGYFMLQQPAGRPVRHEQADREQLGRGEAEEARRDAVGAAAIAGLAGSVSRPWLPRICSEALPIPWGPPREEG